MIIPRYGPTYQFDDLARAWQMCLTTDPLALLMGRLSKLFAIKHVFLFSGARVALYVVLKAYGRPGDVILPAYNCIVVPEAILYAGYHPVFVDIGDCTFNMTAGAVEEAVTRTTSVILLTHQFGIPCDVQEILRICRRHGILAVEDIAPALGATIDGELVGRFGDAAILSFHNTKVVSGGIGGALLTNSDDLAHKVSAVMENAVRHDACICSFAKCAVWGAAMTPVLYPAVSLGHQLLRGEMGFQMVESHADEPPDFLTTCSRFSAALVALQLDRLESNLSRRRELARRYANGLYGCKILALPVVGSNSSPAWIQYPLIVNDRRSFCRYMKSRGIDPSWTFRYLCTDSFGLVGFPNARRAAHATVGLPTYPSLSDQKAGYVCSVAQSASKELQ